MRGGAAVALVAAAFGIGPAAATDPLPAHVIYAAQPGSPTLDEGDGGGNPFAGALIDLLGDPAVRLAVLPRLLRQGTLQRSAGFQQVDADDDLGGGQLRLAARDDGRLALVIVQAAYASGRFPALAGAARDGRRIADAFARAGFAVETSVDEDRPALEARLAAFARSSAAADIAVIYATGHGTQRAGRTYLRVDTPPAIANRKGGDLAIADLAAAVRAGTANLVFWAGCRTAS